MPFRFERGTYNPHAEFPAGIVGEIAQYILDSSPRPVREIALTGAIGMVAGIVGRSHNISGTGLNLYLLLLAPSGTGKDPMTTAVDRLIAAASRIAPEIEDCALLSDIDDAGTILTHLRRRSPSLFAVIGEFGLKMRKDTRIRPNAREQALRAFILETYTHSGKHDRIQVGSKLGTIDSPAVTILGEAAPEHALPKLGDPALEDGFFGRFSVIDYQGGRPAQNYDAIFAPPSDLVEKVAALSRMAKTLNDTDQHGLLVTQTEEAKDWLRKFDKFVDGLMMRESEVGKVLYSRCYLKALKLAAVVAVGQNPTHPVIDLELARWATEFEIKATRNLLTRVGGGVMPTELLSLQRRNKLRTILKKFERGQYTPTPNPYLFTLDHVKDGVVPFDFLESISKTSTTFRRASNETLAENIKQLIKRGEIERVSSLENRRVYGYQGEAYRILDLWMERAAGNRVPIKQTKDRKF